MKWPSIAAAAILPVIAAALAGCSLFAEPGNTNRPTNQRLFTAKGEVMLHVYARENKQDAIAISPEETKPRGFSELIYMGLNTTLQPVFFRRDVDYAPRETPPQPTPQPLDITGKFAMYMEPPSQPRAVSQPPEVTGQFTMDYRRGRLIPVRDHNIEIIEANLAGVTFTIQ
jgi:hypothetical protein